MFYINAVKSNNININSHGYPVSLHSYLDIEAPRTLWYSGNRRILKYPKLAILSASSISSENLVKLDKLLKEDIDDHTSIISGFHSPVEDKCLDFLLEDTKPVIFCPACSLDNMNIPLRTQNAFNNHRMLYISPFPSEYEQKTRELAHYRNRMVAAIADKIIIVTNPFGSKINGLVDEVKSWNKPIEIW